MTFTPQQLEELATAIANPALSLADIPTWPEWFRRLSAADQNAAMRALMASEQPKLDAALRELYPEDDQDDH